MRSLRLKTPTWKIPALRPTLLGIGFALLVGGLAPRPAHGADESIWAGLIYATNEESPTRPPQPLAPVARKLRKIFGYNQFTLLGEQRRPLRTAENEEWLIAGKPFALSVQTKEVRPLDSARSNHRDRGAERGNTRPASSNPTPPRTAPNFGAIPNTAPQLSPPPAPLMSYRLKLMLYQGDKYIVQTDVELDRSSPVFIRGPLFGKGQLILMLQVN